ncbi:MAG: hypothetical protein AAF479_17125 [Pseudomonadota bacterium]
MDDENQPRRIREKLIRVERADPAHLVFGASSHRYSVGPTLTREQIFKVEILNRIELPEAYQRFLLEIGNGGERIGKAAAGPFYGLYALTDALSHTDQTSLTAPCVLSPEHSAETWQIMVADAKKRLIESSRDEEHGLETDDDLMFQHLFGGILPIGPQGGPRFHGLVLNGPHTGRVVNLDRTLKPPKFCYEANFLHWYERWLDEALAGMLEQQNGYWFGYQRAGCDVALLNAFDRCDTREERLDCLTSLGKLTSVSISTLGRLEELATDPDMGLRRESIRKLAQFDFRRADLHLRRMIHGDDAELAFACQTISDFGSSRTPDYVDAIANRLALITDAQAFDKSASVMNLARAEWSDVLRTYACHPEIQVRRSVFCCLWQHPVAIRKRNIDLFVTGLGDDSPTVVHAALQALSDVNDNRLYPAFKEILHRFCEDEQFVLTNVQHRLKEHGFRDSGHFLDMMRSTDQSGSPRNRSATAA